jgi:hypothetical protein
MVDNKKCIHIYFQNDIKLLRLGANMRLWVQTTSPKSFEMLRTSCYLQNFTSNYC